ncbi:MAG: hypothetical protein UY40_C0014G0006 [candidate division CPR1 bacterium GW2011_GWC1_49_13]|uniref:Proline--tRNA ligase n=1 Tax=candidate division CPR1 bacterium GW2011_GWC1_49_13 TaxID=1618342 RepID=A0A0G1YGR0_9BACT|nr:MAG: hypothetical protein UY40_C0014G0006 [candidate division CPR1 bacterium GW2011_GWC1_49_13]
MRYSHFLGQTLREVPKDAEIASHQLLVKGGFVDQLMTGSWTLLPLGWRVITKINDIIREELDKTGAQEMLMPLMHPKEVWNRTGRWDDPGVREIMYQFKDKRGREFGLSFTHEEIVMDLLGKHTSSYKDFPIKVYHFSTKFRNEPRPRGGVLRSREFMMKDLYSAHVTEEDMYEYYWQIKDAYLRAFKRMGLDSKVVEAGGGVFTKNYTHEFQVVSPAGEDTIFYCDKCDFAQNKEIYQGKAGDKCPKCKKGKVAEASAIEVGNIFPLGQKYAKAMNVSFADKDGKKKYPWFASYGIGPARVMATVVEAHHDERGIVWPTELTPYDVYLLHLPGGEEAAEKIYEAMEKAGLEVLFDDREEPAGVKLKDADLIGVPVRVVVSQKSLAAGGVEVARRDNGKSTVGPVGKLAEEISNIYGGK